VAFLLAVTIAVVVFRSNDESAAPGPVRGHVSQSKSPVQAEKRFYIVAAGDTLGAIAKKTGVPLARIRALNPRVAPTALFIDQKIRLR
jgi:LysM repeat protein